MPPSIITLLYYGYSLPQTEADMYFLQIKITE